MPDSLLEKARMENEVHTSLDTKQPNPNPNPKPNPNPNPDPNPNQVHTSLDTKQMANAQGGMETPMGMQVGLRRHAP